MQLSLIFPFAPCWVVPRGGGVFVIGFTGVAPMGFASWVTSSATILGVAGFTAWRSYPAGVAICVRVSSSIAAVLSGFSSGGGGSAHPSNGLPW